MTRLAALVLVIGAALGLVLAFDLASDAGPARSLLLGRVNHAATSTTLTSAKGPALRLVTTSTTTPPLTVSNSTKVVKLNADLLDGKSAADLTPQTRRFTYASSAAQVSPNLVVPHVPTGTYLATLSASLLPDAPNRDVQCEFVLGTTHLDGDEAHYDGGYAGLLSAAGVIALTSSSHLTVECDTTGTSFTFYLPLVVTLTSTDLATDGALTP